MQAKEAAQGPVVAMVRGKVAWTRTSRESPAALLHCRKRGLVLEGARSQCGSSLQGSGARGAGQLDSRRGKPPCVAPSSTSTRLRIDNFLDIMPAMWKHASAVMELGEAVESWIHFHLNVSVKAGRPFFGRWERERAAAASSLRLAPSSAATIRAVAPKLRTPRFPAKSLVQRGKRRHGLLMRFRVLRAGQGLESEQSEIRRQPGAQSQLWDQPIRRLRRQPQFKPYQRSESSQPHRLMHRRRLRKHPWWFCELTEQWGTNPGSSSCPSFQAISLSTNMAFANSAMDLDILDILDTDMRYP
eukprot:s1909_g5.t1